MSKYTKEYIQDKLMNSICTVVFEKKNKEIRTMKCTTKLEFVPKNKHPKSSVNTGELIHAYDVEENDWRSFYVSKVSSIKEE